MDSEKILSISFTPDGLIDLRLNTPIGTEIEFLGALRVAEDYLLAEYKKSSAELMEGTACTSSGKSYSGDGTRVVPRQIALNAYIDARNRIDSRIRSIHEAAEQAEFRIDETLLDNL